MSNQNNPVDLASRFVFDKELGKGAYGTVWAVVDKASGQKYALKLETISNRSALSQAMTNYDILQTIKGECKHFVCAHELFWGKSADGKMYLCTLMDLIDGVDLYKLSIEQRKEYPLTHQQLLDLYKDIVFLHKHGIVHGDVGLRNIILTKSGPRLIDFGNATRTGKQTDWQTKARFMEDWNNLWYAKTTPHFYDQPEFDQLHTEEDIMYDELS